MTIDIDQNELISIIAEKLNVDKSNIRIDVRIEEGLGVEDVLGSVGTATRVRILDGKTKKVLYDGHNTTVLGGRLHLLEKSFGITPYESKLYEPIPFRLVPVANDLSQSEREPYRLRKIVT